MQRADATLAEPGLRLGLLPFRLGAAERRARLASFACRSEIGWFGFEGRYAGPGIAEITLSRLHPGVLGGGGVAALNGGVVAAGFDAAVVLAGLGHFDADVVVTLELSVQFLSLARTDAPLVFRAGLTRSSRGFGFAQAVLEPVAGGAPFATATAMVAPVRP
ncbi:PaaI family thioesterase [Ramlibacter algicola]|uniref:Thioesterase domain-containing protein n=1 Tax=Ramlibacter algicola TaxID=2795217 RepID=A0A934UQF7_9BURK|nr:hotdog domain-containing protein [Ramlibacter algicola]MBK0392589.1 hypothetical protein [Ramlibacter algicola]